MAFWNAPLADAAHAATPARRRCACCRSSSGSTRCGRPRRERAGETVRAGAHRHRPQYGRLLRRQRRIAAALRLFDPRRRRERRLAAGGGDEDLRRADHRRGAHAQPRRGLAFLEIAAVKVRGKERPERIFALLGDENVAGSERFRGVASQAHAKLLAALTGDPAAAREAPGQCRALGWRELAPLYDGVRPPPGVMKPAPASAICGGRRGLTHGRRKSTSHEGRARAILTMAQSSPCSSATRPPATACRRASCTG